MPEQPDLRTTIHIRIRDLRRERSLTQEELADALGISRQSVNAMEAGRCMPSLPVAMQIAAFFSVPLSSVFIVGAPDTERTVTLWNPLAAAAAAQQLPAVNVYHTETALHVECSLAGYHRNDLDIEVGDDFLTISSQGGTLSTQYLHREFAPLPFVRTIRLPVEVVRSEVEAQMQGGVLTITLPKHVSPPVQTTRVHIIEHAE